LIILKEFASVLSQNGVKLSEDQLEQIGLAYPRGQIG
jgi:hypothetical protein